MLLPSRRRRAVRHVDLWPHRRRAQHARQARVARRRDPGYDAPRRDGARGAQPGAVLSRHFREFGLGHLPDHRRRPLPDGERGARANLRLRDGERAALGAHRYPRPALCRSDAPRCLRQADAHARPRLGLRIADLSRRRQRHLDLGKLPRSARAGRPLPLLRGHGRGNHRAQTRRGRAARRQGSGRSRQPREIGIPRHDEP